MFIKMKMVLALVDAQKLQKKRRNNIKPNH